MEKRVKVLTAPYCLTHYYMPKSRWLKVCNYGALMNDVNIIGEMISSSLVHTWFQSYSNLHYNGLHAENLRLDWSDFYCSKMSRAGKNEKLFHIHRSRIQIAKTSSESGTQRYVAPTDFSQYQLLYRTPRLCRRFDFSFTIFIPLFLKRW